MTVPVVPVQLPGDDEVLRALVHRREAGHRDDGNRIALVVSGGGMRGAYAGGMAHALEDAGLSSWFDVVYGSSAGAFVGGALVVGEGRGSSHIFFEDMASRAFIDPRRLGTRQPMVSLDYLIDDVMASSKPMPWERLRDSPVRLRVVATAADDLTPHVLEPETVDEWKRAFRATASIPLLAGRPVELHGRLWIDGSVSEPLPVPRAVSDGATHVLALLNRTVGELSKADPDAPPARWAGAMNRLAPGLGLIAQEGRRLGPVLAVLERARTRAEDGAYVLALAPGRSMGVRGLTVDVARVEQAARVGYATVQIALRRIERVA
ncbi:patatin-like phospholipase family protein [Pseudonocardia sp. GCM10023141]|uniref:patatin-like phospholipase family protein n=1 Tax=Pseudonocardia sp. GCM10023141 TaxID=3252653 RepID=UPI0036150832